jgi:hypothetical protein
MVSALLRWWLTVDARIRHSVEQGDARRSVRVAVAGRTARRADVRRTMGATERWYLERMAGG